MRPRSLVASSSFVLSTLVAFGACVGDDPVGGSPTLDAGASSSSGGTSSGGPREDAAAADADVPAARTLGVFLTSTTYPADFARDLSDGGAPAPDRAWGFVDDVCRAAAGAVPLPHAEGYRAMLVIANKAAEVTRFNQLKEAPRGTDRWCSVSVAARVPSCTPPTAVIFEAPIAIQRGPLHSLIANEYGTAVPTGRQFWSGMFVPEQGGLLAAESLTCTQWSSVEDTGSSDAGAPQGGIGSVAAVDPASTGELTWFGSDRIACASTRLPLLCIEVGEP